MKGRHFRRLALALPNVEEGSHMDHADFRAEGRIFATLSPEEDDWGMVKLSPAGQEEFITEAPHVFSPIEGAQGRAGATKVSLEYATEDITARALKSAFDHLSAATVAKKKKK